MNNNHNQTNMATRTRTRVKTEAIPMSTGQGPSSSSSSDGEYKSYRNVTMADISAATFDEIRWLSMGADQHWVNKVSQVRASLWDKERSQSVDPVWSKIHEQLTQHPAQSVGTTATANSSSSGAPRVYDDALSKVRRNAIHAVLQGLVQQVKHRQNEHDDEPMQGQSQTLDEFDAALEEYGKMTTTVAPDGRARKTEDGFERQEVEKIHSLCLEECKRLYYAWTEKYAEQLVKLIHPNTWSEAIKTFGNSRKPNTAISAWNKVQLVVQGQDQENNQNRLPRHGMHPGDDDKPLRSSREKDELARPAKRFPIKHSLSTDATASSLYYEVTLRQVMEALDKRVEAFTRMAEGAYWIQFVCNRIDELKERYSNRADQLELIKPNVVGYLPKCLHTSDNNVDLKDGTTLLKKAVDESFNQCDFSKILQVFPETQKDQTPRPPNTITRQDFSDWIRKRKHFPGAAPLAEEANLEEEKGRHENVRGEQ